MVPPGQAQQRVATLNPVCHLPSPQTHVPLLDQPIIQIATPALSQGTDKPDVHVTGVTGHMLDQRREAGAAEEAREPPWVFTNLQRVLLQQGLN